MYEQSISFDRILDLDNIAPALSEKMLDVIGAEVCEGFKLDDKSRNEWLERNAEAIKLTMQVPESKSYPWPNAASIKYPLITVAATQFGSRAYPALIPGKNIVNVRVPGVDNDGQKTARAKRVGDYMSYQLTEEQTEWEENQDRLLMMLPIIGTLFKKTYFDPETQQNKSELLHPDNFVIDYFAKSVETARRKTHLFQRYENELEEQFRLENYLRVDLDGTSLEESAIKEASDEAQGMERSQEDDPYTLLEQHCWLDLDGDGYREPYIVTVIKDTSKTVRIVKRFETERIMWSGNKIAKIFPDEYFTKYGFIPAPDGSIMDIGFGILLGPMNKAVNTILNQLVDAGTLANMQGGLLARGIRIRGGRVEVVPGKWLKTDASPEQLHKGVFPWPLKEPSNVLFALLGMLIDSGQKIGSVSDTMLGENPGQNTAATTTMAILEQGLQVFSSIYKRCYRSMTEEFRKQYKLNQVYIEPEAYAAFHGADDPELAAKDFSGGSGDIAPIADPNVVSSAQRLAKAQAQIEVANSAPHLYGQKGMQEIHVRYHQALHVEGIETLFQPDPPPDPNNDPEMIQAREENDREWKKLEIEAQNSASRLEKDQANIIRTLEGVQDASNRTVLEAIKEQNRKDIEEARLALDAIRIRNESRVAATPSQ